MKEKQKYIITINEPCHEKWSDMQPQTGGRFCDSCAKSVIDFTRLSDSQIIGILEKSKGAGVCGRFNKEQLNKIIVQTNAEKSNPALYKILAGLLLLASVETATAQKTPAQKMPVAVSKSQQNIKGEVIMIPAVSGTVTDQNGKPVHKAVVSSELTNAAVVTDKSGKFSIECYKGRKITISKAGYDTQTIINSGAVLKVQLKKGKTVTEIKPSGSDEMIMGDVAYVPVPKKVNYVIDGVLTENFKPEAIDSVRIKSVTVLKNGPSNAHGGGNDVQTVLISTDLSKKEKSS